MGGQMLPFIPCLYRLVYCLSAAVYCAVSSVGVGEGVVGCSLGQRHGCQSGVFAT
jgi:hypothetical protein